MSMTAEAASEPTPPAPQLTPRQAKKADAKAFEERQGETTSWINGFCENWIFAFIIAMAIRHFFIEAYRIPTASMEPMLYGDAALMKADHVVVDKFMFRFTGPERWGVTVFQYPIPEVQGPQGGPIPAVQADGSRLDSFFTRPLLQRNFVKRCLVLPGDVFYIAHGDLFLQDADGSFKVARKPHELQEALWETIYQQGAQEGYLPWEGNGGAAVSSNDSALTLDFRSNANAGSRGSVLFTQPLRNVYVKPGFVNVRDGTKPYRDGNNSGLEQVAVSLTEPLFQWNGKTGSLWDLKQWDIRRLTTKDLDRQTYGTALNDRMNEFLGDIRFRFVLSNLTDELQVQINEGAANAIVWRITASGWDVRYNGSRVAEGSDQLVGKELSIATIDDQLQIRAAGEYLLDPVELAAVDATAESNRLQLQLEGAGTATLEQVAMDRDLHYSRSNILADETQEWKQASRDNNGAAMQSISAVRKLFIPALADASLAAELEAQFESTSRTAWLKPIGAAPETALRAPEGAYLMLGDNSPFSFDGRGWGWVPAENLRGEVLGVAFPRWKWVR